MAELNTRNRFFAGDEILAEPIDANFETVWSTISGNIDSDNIRDGAIKTAHLFSECVTRDKISSKAVDTGQLEDLAVTQEKLGNGAVSSSKMLADSVLRDSIKDGEVVGSKVAADAISSDKIAADAVGMRELASGLLPASVYMGAPDAFNTQGEELGDGTFRIVHTPKEDVQLTLNGYVIIDGGSVQDVVGASLTVTDVTIRVQYSLNGSTTWNELSWVRKTLSTGEWETIPICASIAMTGKSDLSNTYRIRVTAESGNQEVSAHRARLVYSVAPR